MELILGTVLGAAICGALVVIFREALLKRYQHSLDTKLTKVQSTIDTAISDVNVSGSMLANIRTIRKPYEIEALKAMWTEIAELHAMFEDAPAYEDSHTPEQLDRIFQSQGKGSLEDQVVFDALHSCSEGFAEALEEKALKLEDSQHRPFVDVELWGWWALIRKMYFRIGSLLLSSIPQGHYPRWQADPLLQDFCHAARSNGWIGRQEAQDAQEQNDGLWHILFLLRHRFADKAQEAILGNGELDRMDSQTAASEPDRFRQYQSFVK